MNETVIDTPLIKTAEIDSAMWQTFKALVETENEEGFRAYVCFETDSKYLKASPDELCDVFQNDEIALILVADELTFCDPGFPVLCIDPEGQNASFRTQVKHLWIVENNVSIGNLLFEEIAEDQVVDGVFV